MRWRAKRSPGSPVMHGGRRWLKKPLNAGALAPRGRVPTAKLRVGLQGLCVAKLLPTELGPLPIIAANDGLRWLVKQPATSSSATGHEDAKIINWCQLFPYPDCGWEVRS